jgi:hypothetical protein
MSYAIALPLTGYAGWKLLQRTMPAQQAALAAQPQVQRDEAYFRQKIGGITTAGQLVSDRRLLKVALEAFGLGADIDNRYFIRKVLEGGTLSTGSLANKLTDKSYQKFAAAFGFGDFSTPRTQLSTFADEILGAYRTRSFETAVGEQDDDMRLALHAQRELQTLAARSSSESTKWYTILGDAPLREVFETALGLPKAFANLDVDQQLSMIRQKARAQLGSDSVGQFTDAGATDKLVRRFLTRAQIAGFAASSSPAQVALTLLQR